MELEINQILNLISGIVKVRWKKKLSNCQLFVPNKMDGNSLQTVCRIQCDIQKDLWAIIAAPPYRDHLLEDEMF